MAYEQLKVRYITIRHQLQLCQDSQIGLDARNRITKNDANVMAEKYGRAIASYDEQHKMLIKVRVGQLILGGVLAGLGYRAYQKQDYTGVGIAGAGLFIGIAVSIPKKQ